MFELHYDYVCAAGWREHKSKTVFTHEELNAVMDEFERKDYRVLDNPMCVSCERFPDKCPGSRNHIWTSCKNRKARKEA